MRVWHPNPLSAAKPLRFTRASPPAQGAAALGGKRDLLRDGAGRVERDGGSLLLARARLIGEAPRVRHAVIVGVFLSLSAAALTVSPVEAQSYGQYLVVLDDSGSMERSDPRRLAVMAAAALTAALEDGDQVMLVGLNELASGAVNGPRFRSPRELLPQRDSDEGTTALTDSVFARLAAFEGNTPCAQALDRARSILNDVASAGAPQTLLLLTDGACTGALTEADRWLEGVTAHRDGRFRFVLLMRRGSGRPSRQLVRYATETGWQGDALVAFDARALLRAFAEVLSFSRGLRFDDGGRVGLERTFAGARRVRALAVHESGTSPLGIERSSGEPLTGGATYRSPFSWSLRTSAIRPTATPLAVRSPTSGAEVLVIPVYGKLQLEAIVAPCGEAPPQPWDHELPIRAGHPACAWARLTGDIGDTIVPARSFDFEVSMGDDSAMQPGNDGTFHAQLGQLPEGRHEQVFRAHGGALAFPVETRRTATSVSFGVHRITRAEAPDVEVHRIDLGEQPNASVERLALVLHGSYPANARARLRCDVSSGGAAAQCLRCSLDTAEVQLQDRLRVEVALEAAAYCPPLQLGHESGAQNVALSLVIEPLEAQGPLVPHRLPIEARLAYPLAEPIALQIMGGDDQDVAVKIPSPPRPMEVHAVAVIDDSDRLELDVADGELGRAGEPQGSLLAGLTAGECCEARTFDGVLRLEANGATLDVPLQVTVTDPGFWVCPGQKIVRWALAVAAVLLLLWVARGFLSPARFREGAVLVWAESHDALLETREGDDGHRPFARFIETRRGFRRHATLALGGARAPLPSLKRMPDDARLVATAGGGATLVVDRAEALERHTESGGWEFVPVGSHPVPSRMKLRRGEDLYLEVRI